MVSVFVLDSGLYRIGSFQVVSIELPGSYHTITCHTNGTNTCLSHRDVLDLHKVVDRREISTYLCMV